MKDFGPVEIPYLSDMEGRFRSFVLNNRAMGYGRMMQMISEIWREQHGDGAHLANETYAGLAKKQKRCKAEGHDWSEGSEYLWCDRCGASEPK